MGGLKLPQVPRDEKHDLKRNFSRLFIKSRPSSVTGSGALAETPSDEEAKAAAIPGTLTVLAITKVPRILSSPLNDPKKLLTEKQIECSWTVTMKILEEMALLEVSMKEVSQRSLNVHQAVSELVIAQASRHNSMDHPGFLEGDVSPPQYELRMQALRIAEEFSRVFSKVLGDLQRAIAGHGILPRHAENNTKCIWGFTAQTDDRAFLQHEKEVTTYITRTSLEGFRAVMQLKSIKPEQCLKHLTQVYKSIEEKELVSSIPLQPPAMEMSYLIQLPGGGLSVRYEDLPENLQKIVTRRGSHIVRYEPAKSIISKRLQPSLISSVQPRDDSQLPTAFVPEPSASGATVSPSLHSNVTDIEEHELRIRALLRDGILSPEEAAAAFDRLETMSQRSVRSDNSTPASPIDGRFDTGFRQAPRDVGSESNGDNNGPSLPPAGVAIAPSSRALSQQQQVGDVFVSVPTRRVVEQQQDDVSHVRTPCVVEHQQVVLVPVPTPRVVKQQQDHGVSLRTPRIVEQLVENVALIPIRSRRVVEQHHDNVVPIRTPRVIEQQQDEDVARPLTSRVVQQQQTEGAMPPRTPRIVEQFVDNVARLPIPRIVQQQQAEVLTPPRTPRAYQQQQVGVAHLRSSRVSQAQEQSQQHEATPLNHPAQVQQHLDTNQQAPDRVRAELQGLRRQALENESRQNNLQRVVHEHNQSSQLRHRPARLELEENEPQDDVEMSPWDSVSHRPEPSPIVQTPGNRYPLPDDSPVEEEHQDQFPEADNETTTVADTDADTGLDNTRAWGESPTRPPSRGESSNGFSATEIPHIQVPRDQHGHTSPTFSTFSQDTFSHNVPSRHRPVFMLGARPEVLTALTIPLETVNPVCPQFSTTQETPIQGRMVHVADEEGSPTPRVVPATSRERVPNQRSPTRHDHAIPGDYPPSDHSGTSHHSSRNTSGTNGFSQSVVADNEYHGSSQSAASGHEHRGFTESAAFGLQHNSFNDSIASGRQRNGFIESNAPGHPLNSFIDSDANGNQCNGFGQQNGFTESNASGHQLTGFTDSDTTGHDQLHRGLTRNMNFNAPQQSPALPPLRNTPSLTQLQPDMSNWVELPPGHLRHYAHAFQLMAQRREALATVERVETELEGQGIQLPGLRGPSRSESYRR